MMRVLFFGTSEFAVPSLRTLASAPDVELVGVVTQPDRPHGRGLHLAAPPIKRAAVELGISPLLQPDTLRGEAVREALCGLQPDLLALAAYGKLIPRYLLELPKLGPVNLHGSLLPALRGAAPIQWSLRNGDTLTGVTTMWMVSALDAGDILERAEVVVIDSDTAGTLLPRMAEVGAELLLHTLRALASGNCPRTPQDHSAATWAPAFEPRDSRVDWSADAMSISNLMRALSPRPGIYTLFNGRRIKLTTVEHVSGDSEPGMVSAITPDSLLIGAGRGLVQVLQVQPEGSRVMTAGEWARGARVRLGERFE